MDQLTADIPESVRLPFLCLRKLGLFSTNVFKVYSIFALCLSNLIIIAIVQFINIKRDISDFVQNFEDIFAFSLVLGKIVVITYRKKDFIRLIETSKLFLDPNKHSQRIKAEINSIRHIIFRLQKLFLLAMLICIGSAVTFSFLQKTILVGIWTIEGYEVLYHFVMVEQLFAAPFCGIFLWSLHCMYLGFCAETVIQFKILSQYLQEMRANGNNANEMERYHLNKMKICIRHHNLILRFVRELRQTFSLILLVEYVIDGPLICAELIAASQSHSFQHQIRHAAAFATITMELAFVCIPANYVYDEAVAVSDAVYFSDWHSHHFPSLKVPILLMIQNSQNGIVIKAGGLVTINAETVVKVLRVAWSTCSLVKGLRQN